MDALQHSILRGLEEGTRDMEPGQRIGVSFRSVLQPLFPSEVDEFAGVLTGRPIATGMEAVREMLKLRGLDVLEPIEPSSDRWTLAKLGS